MRSNRKASPKRADQSSLLPTRGGTSRAAAGQHRHREESINTQLALLLSKLGVIADAETILSRGQHRPDVMFTLMGLRVIVEGKFADHGNAEEQVLADARSRVELGLAHIAVAVVYPKRLRIVSTNAVETELSRAKLRFRVISEFGDNADQWSEGSPEKLMDALRRAQESLANDDVVEATARALSERLEGIARLWSGQAGACDRLGALLGMKPTKGEKADLAANRRQTAAKVAALVLANALIFQQQLSNADGRIQPLAKIEKDKNPVLAAKSHWHWIWKSINYVPIFKLGERVLDELPPDQHTGAAFNALLREAKAICNNQAALRHDLMGRIYHWLLHDAKFLGTYYTSVPAATLLLKLAFSNVRKPDLGDPAALIEFKCGDLACGTGTLLMAAAQAISDTYISNRAASGRTLVSADLQTLHRALMENVLHGYDVLSSAVHLTASTLAMLAPEISFVRMNLEIMPMGMDGNTPKLGSLEFFRGREIPTQISLDDSQLETFRAGAHEAAASKAVLPQLDLCVMNPPFVRSVGGNLLFGSLPDEERGQLQSQLKKYIRDAAKEGHPSSATAGLGSVFVALADVHLKPDGRLAFVLPAALASGEAWAQTRKLISAKYHLEMVIASHDAERFNFSENTDLSEILFIARRRRADESPQDTTYVNLRRNPRTIHEALDLAHRIIDATPHPVGSPGFESIAREGAKLGEVVSAPAPVDEANWTGALFAQTELFRAFVRLAQGSLAVPGSREVSVPLCFLDELGDLGFDRRDVHDAFTHTEEDVSAYPAFWNHKADKVLSIHQKPNSHLVPRTNAAKGRPLRNADQLWTRAGRILLVERLWPITHRVLAVGFNKRVMGNTWWAFHASLSDAQEKALLLWLNSTPSLLLMFGRRVATRSAWMQMKKPAWAATPVLDVRKLSKPQLAQLAASYDRIATLELQALAKLDADTTREQIDTALSLALGLPQMATLRALLAREPGLTGASIVGAAGQSELFDEVEEEQLRLI